MDKADLIEGYLQTSELKQKLGIKSEKTPSNSSMPLSQEQKLNRKKKAKRGPKKEHSAERMTTSRLIALFRCFPCPRVTGPGEPCRLAAPHVLAGRDVLELFRELFLLTTTRPFVWAGPHFEKLRHVSSSDMLHTTWRFCGNWCSIYLRNPTSNRVFAAFARKLHSTPQILSKH